MRPCHPLAARVLSALLLSAAALPAQGTFAGTVTFQVDPSQTGIQGGPTAMTVMVSGPRRRFDLTLDTGPAGGQPGGMGGIAAMMGRSISTIMDENSDTVKTLFNDKKVYFAHAMPSAKSQPPNLQAQSDSAAKSPNIQFTKTGKTETIAGVPCEDYLVNTGDAEKQTLVCTARGLGFLWGPRNGLMGQMTPGMSSPYADVMRQFKDGFFPLKVAQVTDGQEHLQMIATKVDRTTPPASAFEVPPDFTTLQMGGMGLGGPGARNP